MRTSSTGINVIGHFTSSAGLGHTTRIFADMLLGRGFEVAGFDIEAHAQEVDANLAPDMLFDSVQAMPFTNTLVITSLDRLAKLWLKHGRTLVEPRSRIAGLVFWELPVIPAAWVPSLQMFDVILTCSAFVRQAVEHAVPEVPTLHAEHPIRASVASAASAPTRARYGIEPNATVFCCSFDPRSGFPRKNPLGAIDAWLRAFPTREDVRLVVKSNGPSHTRGIDPAGILERARADPRILWIEERLSHSDVMTLLDACDVIVSLHRSEGLGLVPMEAMALGKLVIATGYSGNMTFMSEQNSLLVPYRLAPPADEGLFMTRAFAGPRAVWAEPDLDQAASMMQSAAHDSLATARLGDCARREIAARQVTAWEGHFVGSMLRIFEDSEHCRKRPAVRRHVMLREVISATLLRRNLKTVIGRWRGT